ncbi:isochorismatase family protein [Glycomyces salinus]|uniref:isochorismatase family protein n=1 Tax=Glycomyces salinus TaxID=980294 RepID=UPI0018ED5C72|nr:isochorismatase family protein [Glycomyces salinus]
MTNRALVVIDVQQEYFTGGLPIAHPPTEESLPNITAAMDAAAAADVPVVVVRHTSPAGAPLFDRGTAAWELHPEIAKRHRDLLVEKHTPSAFAGTGLADWLGERGVDTVTVVGYMTQNCDASTAYEAVGLGIAVELLSDATGTLPISNGAGSLTARQLHQAMLVVMASNFASVAATGDWIAAVERGEDLPAPDIWASTEVARA